MNESKKDNSNDRYQIIYESAEKDIRDYIDSIEKVDAYTKFRNSTERLLLHKMQANGLTKLGDVEIVKEPILKNISLGDLRGLLNDESILEHIVFHIDLNATVNSLKQNLNLTNVGVEPLIKKILSRTNSYEERLKVVKE